MIKGASRRNPVDGRSAQLAAIVAGVAGIGTAAAGGHPTGSTLVDIVLIIAGTAACVWAAASAPWWALTLVAIFATALAPNVLLAVLGIAAFGLAVSIGALRVNWAWARSLTIALCAQVLARQHGGKFGVSAIIGIAMMIAIFAIGGWRRPSKVRRRAIRVMLVAAGFVVLAGAGLAASAISAHSTVNTANSEAHRGLDLLSSGDVDGARAAFQQAHQSFQSASDSLTKPWAQPARLLPVLAQNRNSAADLAEAAASATASIDTILSELNFDAVKPVDGRIDLDAVAALEKPLTDLTTVLDNLSQASHDAASPWLLHLVQKGISDLDRDLAKERVQGDNALRVVRVVPDMLGKTGKRVYFVAFCTPSEARGSLGFMGNFAEVTADEGKLSITRFGRTTADLNPGGDPDDRVISGMDEFLKEWGQFGFNTGPGGTAAPDVWQQVTFSRDFPSTAQVISQLYPQSGGQPIDGVFALDPAALAGLLKITGPISVDGINKPLTAANAEQYLLLDQYRDATSKPDRVDALESLANAASDHLFNGTLPDPRDLAKIFGPLARAGHLAAWSPVTAEEALFQQFHADDALPVLDGGDGIGLAINNTAGSKIDSFLRVSLDYSSSRDSASGQVRSVATLTITNTAPAAGLPDYVIGSVHGLPLGMNRMYLTVYTALGLTSATRDGQPLDLTAGVERGWKTYSNYLNFGAGQTSKIVMNLASTQPINGSDITVIVPALAVPATIHTGEP
ncbi:MAG: hypothetical protein JWM34_4652 [Ilumatobacteraceae bacterium]|nr:hypothetical protein [Ilumatobacteraceae bacterium]